MTSQAKTVEQYLSELPDDRREAVRQVRQTVLANLPDGLEEGMQYGMIGYYVPHSVFPAGYHCDPKQPLPVLHIANQKNFVSVYLFFLYMNEADTDRFVKAYEATGKKLNMGKSCVRFKKIEDFPLEVLADTIRHVTVAGFIEQYQLALSRPRSTLA